jgi:hypothetical protein
MSDAPRPSSIQSQAQPSPGFTAQAGASRRKQAQGGTWSAFALFTETVDICVDKPVRSAADAREFEHSLALLKI